MSINTQNDRILFPLRSPPVPSPVKSLPHRARVNLFGCCVQLSIGGRLKPRRISFYLFLSNNSMAQTMRQQPPQSSSPCAPSPKNISYHFGRLLVGCCVPTPSRSHQNPRPRRSLIFFRHSNRRPKRRVNVLPTHSSPAASPIKLPPCRRHHRSVHCCVDPTSGGHPRPVLRPSLIFRWAPFRCPKQGNPQQRARTWVRAGHLC